MVVLPSKPDASRPQNTYQPVHKGTTSISVGKVATSSGGSCESTQAPSVGRTDSNTSSLGKSDIAADVATFPLPSELQDNLVGPLGVSSTGWTLPPWCQTLKGQLHHSHQHMACAWNAGDSPIFDRFEPLCYSGSFGRVQMFCSTVGNTLGLRPGELVALKHKTITIEDSSGMDRELELLRECSGNHVMPMYLEVVEGTGAWVVMPYVESSLNAFLQQHMCWEDVPCISLQIAQGVKEIHDKNVLHRDLKLDNIMISRAANGLRVYVADLGAASGGSHQWSCQKFVTTLEYAAPEIWETGLEPGGDRNMRQIRSLAGTYSVETDLWAVSVVLMHLVLRSPWIPGVFEGKPIAPFVMYLGVLKLASAVEHIVNDLPGPVASLLRLGLQTDAHFRRGGSRRGMDGILELVTEWCVMSMAAEACAARVNTPRVLETFASSRNELVLRERGIDLCPSAFAPVPLIPGPLYSNCQESFQHIEVIVQPPPAKTCASPVGAYADASSLECYISIGASDLESGTSSKGHCAASLTTANAFPGSNCSTSCTTHCCELPQIQIDAEGIQAGMAVDDPMIQFRGMLSPGSMV